MAIAELYALLRCRTGQNGKLQHWQAFQAENGWKAAPVLEFASPR